jgi:drug/metabolite transporter (DMT)-like permease
MQETTRITLGSALAISNGILIAITYDLLKSFGMNVGLDIFVQGSMLCAICYVSISLIFRKVPLFEFEFVIRGIILGLTQIFITIGLSKNSVSATVVSSTVGVLVGTLGGRMLLKEKIGHNQKLGFFIALSGAGLRLLNADFSLSAVIAGFLTGSNFVLTRKVMKNNRKMVDVVFLTLLYSSLTAGLFLIAFGLGETVIAPVQWSKLIILVTLTLGIQFSTCLVNSLIDTQLSGVFSLSRIPASLAIDACRNLVSVDPRSFLGAFLILVGGSIVWFYKNAKFLRK